jgi:hypothetical protein
MTANRPSSRDILRTAFETLRRHPRLMWFPLLSAVATAMFFGLGAAVAQLAGVVAGDPCVDLGMWSWLADPSPTAEVTVRRGWIAGGLLSAISVQIVTMVCAVALSHATMEAMAGRQWSCGTAIRHALRKFGPIATVSVIAAGIGYLMGRRGKQGAFAKAATSMVSLAWWATTYLVVPVLAREDKNGLASIGRSATLFKETWKDAFVGRLVLGWVWGLFILAAGVPTILCIVMGASAKVFVLAIAMPVLLALALATMLRTLDTIYRTALYIFATEGVIPEPFDDPELHEIFCVNDSSPPV